MNVELSDTTIAKATRLGLDSFKSTSIKGFFIASVERFEKRFSVAYGKLERISSTIIKLDKKTNFFLEFDRIKNDYRFFLEHKTKAILMFQMELLKLEKGEEEIEKLESELNMQIVSIAIKEFQRAHRMQESANYFEHEIRKLLGHMKIELGFLKAVKIMNFEAINL